MEKKSNIPNAFEKWPVTENIKRNTGQLFVLQVNYFGPNIKTKLLTFSACTEELLEFITSISLKGENFLYFQIPLEDFVRISWAQTKWENVTIEQNCVYLFYLIK